MKVSISVPKREGFPGYWVLQRFFAAGIYEVEIDETTEEGKRQMTELKEDPIINMLEGDAKPTPVAATIQPEPPHPSPAKPFKSK